MPVLSPTTSNPHLPKKGRNPRAPAVTPLPLKRNSETKTRRGSFLEIMKYSLSYLLSFLISLPLFAQNYEWAVGSGGIDADVGKSLVVDLQGNIFVIGNFTGTTDLDPTSGITNFTSNGSYDIFLSKYDSLGNYIWAVSFGGSGTDQSLGVVTDSIGNVYIIGYFRDTVDFDASASEAILVAQNDTLALGNGNTFVLKYDGMGNFQWVFQNKGVGTFSFRSLAIDLSDNLYITGDFTGTIDFDPSSNIVNLASNGNSDLFVAKYSAAGDYIWAFNCGGSYAESGSGISTDIYGNTYIIGTFGYTADFDPSSDTAYLTGGSSDLFIAKYDSTGNYSWAIALNGGNFGWEKDITVDTLGNLYIFSQFGGIVDFDPSPDSAILNSWDCYCIASYDSSGMYRWASIYDCDDPFGSYPFGLTDLSCDMNGNVYVTGYTSVWVSQIPAIYQRTFISKFDMMGVNEWTFEYDGTNSNGGSGIINDIAGNIYTTGWFVGVTDFDGSSNYAQQSSSSGSSDIYVAKYSLCWDTINCYDPNYIYDETRPFKSKIKIYPNPFCTRAVVKLTPKHVNSTLQLNIYGITGRKLKTYSLSKNQTEITLRSNEIGTGMFFVQLVGENGFFATEKIIITGN